ncbi:MAG: hypothetical protein M5U16_12050 [Hyphomicrobium sp.]|nr:hypothetical protein [Hyphomicrobium sp.]
MRIVMLLAVITAAAAASPTVARIQPDIVCLDPDMEFPVACDDEE